MGAPGSRRRAAREQTSARLVRASAAGAIAIAIAIAGCGSGGDDATQDLQRFLKGAIAKEQHRSVASVGCTPNVSEVVENSTVNFRCQVRFADGGAYTTPASITNPSQQFGWGYYRYGWDDPPPLDITRLPLPPPGLSLSATSPRSLFHARNLRPAVQALASRMSSGELILSLALYPGELEAVIGANGAAQRVTVDVSGRVAVNGQSRFAGSRDGIEISQLDPAVPERLANEIAARGHIPTSGITRFTLTLSGTLAGWAIDTRAAATRFRAPLMGESLTEITTQGSRRVA